MIEHQMTTLGDLQAAVEDRLNQYEKDQIIARLWAKDPGIWKADAHHQKIIKNRLGWLDSIDWLETQADDLKQFQDTIKQAGFSHAVLCGMGGSSLAPEVLRQTFGGKSGWPAFFVLDSTDPEQVADIEKQIDLQQTLFIVSTKSGTTVETVSFYQYFFEKLKQIKGDRAGENFVAITDAGTPLVQEGGRLGFRRVFINPSNVGGRFSVLSYFGMVPAAVIGVPIKEMIQRIKMEKEVSSANQKIHDIPGAILGVILGEAVKKGRDKLTIYVSEEIGSYGLWVEQLLAESLGKENKGIVPIFGENVTPHTLFGSDRLFVSLSCGKLDQALSRQLDELSEKGYPVVHIKLADPLDLGRQFYRWAIATAIAGITMEVDPFDEPNVQESKDRTVALLKTLQQEKKFPKQEVQLTGKCFEASFSQAALKGMKGKVNLTTFLSLLSKHDYIMLGAYLPYQASIEKKLNTIRLKLSARSGCATMFGFGPRYLHSTGQLHKGGANNCLIIQIVGKHQKQLQVPGQIYGFSELEYAQALGDFQALDAKNRRAVQLRIEPSFLNGLNEIEKLLS